MTDAIHTASHVYNETVYSITDGPAACKNVRQVFVTNITSLQEPDLPSGSWLKNRLMPSGVFRMSVRRGRGAVGVEGGVVWWSGVGWTLPQKKIIFCPQNDKFGCSLMQFLRGRKHGQSLEAFGHGFYASIAKLSLQKQCKNYPKFTVRPKGGGQSPHRPLNTPQLTPIICINCISKNVCSMCCVYCNIGPGGRDLDVGLLLCIL